MNDHLPARIPASAHPSMEYQYLSPAEEYPASPASSRVRRFLVFLRRLWWIPVLTLLLAVSGTIGYIVWAPPTFVSSAGMWETGNMRLPEGALFTEDIQTFLATQVELLRSPRLQGLALARLAASGTNSVPLDSDGKPLKVKLVVAQAPKSAVLMIQASSSDPAYTRAFLNALMAEYLDYKKNVRKTVSGDTLASISEQTLRLERDLKADQNALTTFERTNNLAILQEEGTVAGGYLARLKTQLSDLQLDQKLIEAAALEQDAAGPGRMILATDSTRGAGRTSTSAPSTTTPDRLTAFQEVELLKIQRERLSKYLRPKHPKIVKLDADIARGQTLIEMYRRQDREQLAASLQADKMRIESVSASIKEWEAKVVAANERIAEADRLKLNVTRSQTLFERLVNLLHDVDISRNIDHESIAILEPASVALRSYKLEMMLCFLAVIGGLAAGLGIIYVVQVYDDRLTSLVEISERVGEPVVGQLPDVRPPQRMARVPLLEINDDRHMYAESYRNLRSALMFMAIEGQRPKVLLITSALPNEGKSTVAANLARTLALGGSRVLLIDGDLRKGVLHELMEMQDRPGLAELFRRPDDLEKIIQFNSLPNLGFISRGNLSGNSGELFLSPVFDRLLSRVRDQFDYILIDSSPVFAADDATSIAPKVDGTIFVVRRSVSRARAVCQALDMLYQRQSRILGLIFNGANAESRSYYFYKYDDYHARTGKPPAAKE